MYFSLDKIEKDIIFIFTGENMKETIEYGLRHDYDMMISHMKAPDAVKFDVPSGATYYVAKLHYKTNRFKYIFKVMYGNEIDFIACRFTRKDIIDQIILYEKSSFEQITLK